MNNTWAEKNVAMFSWNCLFVSVLINVFVVEMCQCQKTFRMEKFHSYADCQLLTKRRLLIRSSLKELLLSCGLLNPWFVCSHPCVYRYEHIAWVNWLNVSCSFKIAASYLKSQIKGHVLCYPSGKSHCKACGCRNPLKLHMAREEKVFQLSLLVT